MSSETVARLDALEAMPDDQIDFSDIPEVFDFSGWKRVPFRPIKHQISFRVDVDVLMFFQIEGKGYQTKMNKVLRDYMHQKRREAYIAEFGEPTEEDRATMPKSNKRVSVGRKEIAVKLKARKKKPKSKAKVLAPARTSRTKTKRKKSPSK